MGVSDGAEYMSTEGHICAYIFGGCVDRNRKGSKKKQMAATGSGVLSCAVDYADMYIYIYTYCDAYGRNCLLQIPSFCVADPGTRPTDSA